MPIERMRYYKGNVCDLTGEQCDFCESRYSERTNDCRSCLVPIYMMLLEERDKK